MKMEGVIYDASESLTLSWGVVRWAGLLLPTLGVKKLFSRLGSLLIIVSLIGFLFVFGPLIKKEIRYQLQPPIYSGFGVLLQQNTNFALIIPKISVWTKIAPNIDPGKRTEYLGVLRKGVAHAKGSVLPGMKGNLYIFGHSSGQNPVFSLLNKLETDDEVIVYFQGRQYRYQVTEKQILPRNDIYFFQPQSEKEQLILQTCWPLGTDLKQLVVIAVPAS